MKAKILHLCTAFLLFGAVLLSAPVLAQHEGLSPSDSPEPSHLEYTNTDEKVPDHDMKVKVATRDSVVVHNHAAGVNASRAKADPNRTANGNEEDEDALSFNFLYYIIQKFKISDLVDEQ